MKQLVICVDDVHDYIGFNLTKGKIYVLIAESKHLNRFWVINDEGHEQQYCQHRFKLISNEDYCNYIGII